MTHEEHAEQASRVSKFQAMTGKLENLQIALEDLKFESGTLRFDIGGGRSTFQTFSGHETQAFRPLLIEAFRNAIKQLQCEIASL